MLEENHTSIRRDPDGLLMEEKFINRSVQLLETAKRWLAIKLGQESGTPRNVSDGQSTAAGSQKLVLPDGKELILKAQAFDRAHQALPTPRSGGFAAPEPPGGSKSEGFAVSRSITANGQGSGDIKSKSQSFTEPVPPAAPEQAEDSEMDHPVEDQNEARAGGMTAADDLWAAGAAQRNQSKNNGEAAVAAAGDASSSSSSSSSTSTSQEQPADLGGIPMDIPAEPPMPSDDVDGSDL